jgi:2'-5' RNA ligase
MRNGRGVDPGIRAGFASRQALYLLPETRRFWEETSLKTRQPLILTAHIDEADLEPFDYLRRKHFPPERNVLKAHVTMFHRLPGEYRERIVEALTHVAGEAAQVTAAVSGLRHLGAGVAFTIASPELEAIRAELKTRFLRWLGPQDMQVWQPHITIQNKVSQATANSLYDELAHAFHPQPIRITGLDLWKYLGDPWQLETAMPFRADKPCEG